MRVRRHVSPNTSPRRASWAGLAKICCWAGTLLISAAGLPATRAAEAPPLLWAADAEGGAPFIFKDPKRPAENQGFEVELAELLSRELGRPIEHRQYAFDNLLIGLERGDFQLAMNGLEVTPDRERRIRFTRPYYIYRLQLVARADENRFETLDECGEQKLTVGTLGDTAAARILEQKEIAVRFYDGQAEPFRDLELGRIDAVLLDLPIVMYFAAPNPLLKLTGPPVSRGKYAIALHPDEEELAQQIDAALLKFARDGELRKIYEKWQIWNDDQQVLTQEVIPPIVDDVIKDAGREMTLPRYFPLLLDAAVMTIFLSVVSMAVAMALGLGIAIARLYGPKPVQWLAVTYVEFFRGIPVMLLLYFLYYGIPSVVEQLDWGVSFKPSDFTVAIFAFGLNYAAYEAEIYRAGIGSIAVGQWEAAASLGMSRPLTFRRIILPQALRVILPPVTNDFVALFKDTSLVSVIGVVELTKQYQMLSKSSQKYLEIGFATAALYLVMSVPLGYLARKLEQRWGK